MNCRDFEKQIQHLLDQRADLESNSSIQCHASQCTDCARKLSVYQQIFEAETLNSSLEASSCNGRKSILEDSVGELLHLPYDPRQAEQQQRAAHRTQQLAGALAGCVALALVVALSFLSSGSDAQREIASSDIDSPDSTELKLGFGALEESQLRPGSRAGNSGAGNSFGLSLNTYHRLGLERAIWPKSESLGEAKMVPVSYQRRHPIESIQSYYKYTSSLPGVKPWASGINEAARLIQRSIEEKPEKPMKKPSGDFGHSFDAIDWSFRTIV